MQISVAALENLGACEPAINAFKKYLVEKNLKSISLEKLIEEIINRNNYFNWGSWLLTHLMTREETIKYAAFAAKEVLPIFEARYPQDERPRKAIEAAENYLNNKTSGFTTGAAFDAAYAADAAFAAGGYYAIATTAAADAAAYAAATIAAANAATTAATTADAAAYASDADADAYVAYAASNKSKILLYGLKIIQRRTT